MVERKNSILFIFVCALSCVVLFTYIQNYYSVVIHLILFIGCLLSARKLDEQVYPLLVLGILAVIIIATIAIDRKYTTPVAQLGFFLHYLTWPVLLLVVVKDFTNSQKLALLRLVIFLCILSNLLSLSVLLSDSEASRQLAGAASDTEMQSYQAQGVGGYGYVYAMVFLTYGAIVWLKNTTSFLDKALLIIYLVTNYIFILYASYTIAILLVLAMTIAALTSKMNYARANTILFCFMIFVLIFGDFFLEFFIDLAKGLGLDWVYDRMSKLLEAQNSGDFSSLKRWMLYQRSINGFLNNPFLGGNIAGGHSQILDSFARFGIFGAFVPYCFYKFSKVCINVTQHRNLVVFYLAFLLFALIDTCSAMQIPIIVFFVCPMISMIMISKEQNELDTNGDDV